MHFTDNENMLMYGPFTYEFGWPWGLRGDEPAVNQRLVDMGCQINDDNFLLIMAYAGPKSRMQFLDLKLDISHYIKVLCFKVELIKQDKTGRWEATLADWNLLQSL